MNNPQAKKLLSSLTAGLVIGIISILAYITPMAALVFSGNLKSYMAMGIGITLVSAAIIGIVVALRSSFAGMIALPMPEEMAILATIATSIEQKMMDSATDEEIFLTVVAAIALTSVLTGTFLLLLGQFKIGELIRFLPYPVVGGFLAGLGCLLCQGGIKVMSQIAVNWQEFFLLFKSENLLRWIPGLILAIVLLILSRRYRHFLTLPVSIFVAVGLFYLTLFLTHTSLSEASEQGWLLGPFPQGNLWQPITFTAFTQANWTVVFEQINSMITVMLITALSLLLVSSGLELETKREIDLDQELRATGIANLISGLSGGMVGSHAVTTVLVDKMAVKSREVGIFAALLYLGVLGFGLSFLSWFPRPVLGALLLYLGLDLLRQWLYEAWYKLPRTEYGIIILIMIIIVAVGFVEGVAAGLGVAIILFVVNYSQQNVAKFTISGVTYSSQVRRSFYEEYLLKEEGEKIYILSLQGLIFFGTAHKLLQQIQHRLKATSRQAVEFVVLDFALVTGLDSSAVLSFLKLKQVIDNQNIYLIFTNLSPMLRQQLESGGILDQEQSIKIFPDLDRGVEWCENRILEFASSTQRDPGNLEEQLADIFLDSEMINQFINYLLPLNVNKDQVIFNQGDPVDGLYFLTKGQISVILNFPDGSSKRLSTYNCGTIFGEIGLYQKSHRSASVIADQASQLYYLSQVAFERLEMEQPALASIFHRFIVCLLSQRLLNREKELQTLLNK
jgi:SulP family sulfate permease